MLPVLTKSLVHTVKMGVSRHFFIVVLFAPRIVTQIHSTNQENAQFSKLIFNFVPVTRLESRGFILRKTDVYTGLFEIIFWVLTTCHTLYT
jgi:hypothetical protein